MNKLTTSPLRIIHGAVEETTDWVYGFLSLLSDLMFEDEEESEKGILRPEAFSAIFKELSLHC